MLPPRQFGGAARGEAARGRRSGGPGGAPAHRVRPGGAAEGAVVHRLRSPPRPPVVQLRQGRVRDGRRARDDARPDGVRVGRQHALVPDVGARRVHRASRQAPHPRVDVGGRGRADDRPVRGGGDHRPDDRRGDARWLRRAGGAAQAGFGADDRQGEMLAATRALVERTGMQVLDEAMAFQILGCRLTIR